MKNFTLTNLLNFLLQGICKYSTEENRIKFDLLKSNLRRESCSNFLFCSNKMKKLGAVYLLFIFFLFSNFLTAQIIPNIDGNPSEWGVSNVNLFPVSKYVLDPFGTGQIDDQFTSSKDFFLADGTGSGYLSWVDGQTKAKNDIANAAAILYNGTLYFAGDRTSNNGDAQIGFWFFLNGTSPRVLKTTPNRGGDFAPAHVVGDLLILADFTGGGNTATVTIYKWVGTGGDVPNTDGRLSTTNLSGTVAINNSTTYSIPSGWSFVSPTYDTNEFYEGQVNLGDLDLTNTCFGGFLLEARSSQSVTASLDDFVGGTFNVRPKVTINNVTVCSGQPAVFTATPDGGVAPLTYSFNGGPFTSSNTYTIDPANESSPSTVSVVVKGGEPNFCESDIAVGTLTVLTAPNCSITGADLACPNSASNNYSGPAGQGLSYSWSISGNGSIVGPTNQQNVSVTAGAACGQDYVLSLTVSNGVNCSSSCNKTVSVNDTEKPIFTFCPADANLGCNPSGIPDPGNVTATDNCGTPSISSQLGQIQIDGCNRSQTRTYTATDSCGNTATCIQVFT